MDLFAQGDPDAFATGLYLQFIDLTTGWLMTVRVTSSNFDLGALFATVDGAIMGTTQPPGWGPRSVRRPKRWMDLGRRSGDELYRTVDGGRTGNLTLWTRTMAAPVYGQLRFQDNNYGLLPVLVNAYEGARIEFYASDENGRSVAACG